MAPHHYLLFASIILSLSTGAALFLVFQPWLRDSEKHALIRYVISPGAAGLAMAVWLAMFVL